LAADAGPLQMTQISLGLGLRSRIWRRRAKRAGVSRSHAVQEVMTMSELLASPAAPLEKTRAKKRTEPLQIAFVIPFFFPGSGGHMTIANVIRGLERRGHSVSIWIDDTGGRQADPENAAQLFAASFGPFAADVHYGLEDWGGADVAVATAWQTVARVRVLGDTGARAYFVQDHEVEFFPTSYMRQWADDSYRHGFYPVTAGSWLADVMKQSYGQKASYFELGIDAELYQPVPDVQRRENVVAFYGRVWTHRRAVPVVLAALYELKRRRPETELWAFGEPGLQQIDAPVQNLGVLTPEDLAKLYSEATVGLALSMTNYSLVAQEMLACGLPCVELASPSSIAAFGRDGAVDLAPLDPSAIADALQRLLDDPALRAARVAKGAELVAQRTWDAAAEGVEAGLREALKRRAGA
jgi:glycosyltransferase involved in cell wall biosynthesis